MQKLTRQDSQGNTIHLYVYETSVKPIAIVQIIHGASEHFARYGMFAEYLNQHGFTVVGCDILGHGLSTDTYDYVHFADRNGSAIAYESVLIVKNYIQETYPELPVYLIGHSMGSFLARKLVIDFPNHYQKTVWSGTAFVPGIITTLGTGLASVISWIKGPKYISELILGMAIKANPKKMRKDKLIDGIDEEWLTRDKEIQDYYHNSPMCGQPMTVSTNRDMFRWIGFINQQRNLAKANLNLPIFIVSGANDPLSDYGKTVIKLYQKMKSMGYKNVAMKLYPDNRHEILNELDKEMVYADILQFLL